ncbi:UBP1-associated protein 2A [Camellia lanceoleosa]|uniref:UBP1-associated protein 2A n=1 Tax=Camellia lanceoleosa TaxID=1840588 RepID=A0ACC0FLI3_9ERIC|nr:UBP1-associated protein 2A [Camellia lanceoleosa]
MAIMRSGRGRPFPVDNQPYPTTSGRGRGHEEEELVRNPLVPEEQESAVEEEEEFVESLIEGLQKESLVALVMEAISIDPHLIEWVRSLAEVDPAQREISVSYFGWQDMTPLTSETLNSFFGRYGEIENCTINVEEIDGETEGRAYITFKQQKAAWEAAKQPSHRIGDIHVRCILRSLWRFPNPSRWLQLPGVGGGLRYKYKLAENQYATTSSTTEEEKEPLEKLLEALGTYNLVSLVKEGLMKTPTILASLYKHAEIDPTLRHIVAYRIGPYFMTNRMIVNSVFEKYGEIERCRFDDDGVQVLFKHQNSAWKVLKEPYLKISDYLMRPSGSGDMLFWMNC